MNSAAFQYCHVSGITFGSEMRRRKVVVTSKKQRGRVSNGNALFLDGVDGRSAEARRFRDILAEIASDLGGFDTLSEAQRQLVRRCALLGMRCEIMEAAAISGAAEIDIELYGRLTDRLGRTLQRLGIKRVARDVTPRLRDYIDGSDDDRDRPRAH